MSATWRLILDDAPSGAWNMAIDMALADAVRRGEAPPTLRFYSWEPACLSLGYGQRFRDVDTQRVSERGWHVVRRPTGGQAILHTDELTYSVTLPDSDTLVRGDIVESYRHLSRGLQAGLELLGARTQANPKAADAPKVGGPVCFEVPSDYEITADGKKLIGSAQRRRDGVVLQHGAIPLYGDISRICDALAYADEDERAAAKAKVLERATTLEAVLGDLPAFDDIVGAFMDGFADTFDIRLEQGDLTADERACAQDLYDENYNNFEWTTRR